MWTHSILKDTKLHLNLKIKTFFLLILGSPVATITYNNLKVSFKKAATIGHPDGTSIRIVIKNSFLMINLKIVETKSKLSMTNRFLVTIVKYLPSERLNNNNK